LTFFLFVSCDKYAREDYPELVSKSENYQHVNSCFSEGFDDLNKLPSKAKSNIEHYLKNRLSKKYYERLEFNSGYVLSDKPIEIERSDSDHTILALLGENRQQADCDTLLSFPIYAAVYELKIPEIGIESIRMNLMLDSNGNLIKDIEFPETAIAHNLIPIDSIHSELIRRNIPSKKLYIDLWFSKKNKSLFWSTFTLIQEGSIFGPSCFPEVEYHFKMDAFTGEIINYEFETYAEYLDDLL